MSCAQRSRCAGAGTQAGVDRWSHPSIARARAEASPAPPPGPPPGGPPVFFERPAAPTGPPAKAKSLAIGGEAPKKAATVTIGGDGAPQFFERPAPPEGAPSKAKSLSIGGDAAPATVMWYGALKMVLSRWCFVTFPKDELSSPLLMLNTKFSTQFVLPWDTFLLQTC